MKRQFLLLTISVILLAICTSQTIPYQSHSFNDVDYILQQLIKGTDSFKIDISAIGMPSCHQYSTWKWTDNRCESEHSNKIICCLGLRGDTSSGPRLNDYFNTTTDLLNVMLNPKYDFIWQKEKRLPRYNRTIYLAMNFQYGYKHSQLTRTWLSNMILTIQNRNLDIQLILASPGLIQYFGLICSDHKAKCDNKARIIADYPWIIQGCSLFPPNVTYGLVANFDIEFPSLPFFCSTFFPSYGASTPYFFYEVSHEQDVNYIVTTYMSDTCNRSSTHPDLSSIRITANIDQEMVQNYLPKANPFTGLKAVANILIDTLIPDSLVFLSYYEALQDVTHIQVRSLEKIESMGIVSDVQIEGAAATKMAYKAPYLLIQNQTQAQIFSVDTTSNFSLKSVGTISNSGITTDFVVYNDEVYLVQVEVEGQCQANSLTIITTNFNTGKLVFSQCTDPIKAFNVNEIQSANLALAVDDNNVLRGLLFVSATYISNEQEKDAIFAFGLSMRLDQINIVPSFVIINPKSYIDFGVDPSVKIVVNNGTFYVLEAHSNGVCQCGNLFNNGNPFKCGIPATTNSHLSYLQNVDYLMNYNWGRLDDFEARINSGRYISSCDSQIMHAKFYNGEKPSGTVFRDPLTGSLKALFVSQYVDYNYLPLITKLFCGSTMPNNSPSGEEDGSVAINVFDILDYYLFDYL